MVDCAAIEELPPLKPVLEPTPPHLLAVVPFAPPPEPPTAIVLLPEFTTIVPLNIPPAPPAPAKSCPPPPPPATIRYSIIPEPEAVKVLVPVAVKVCMR
jgi:hypothetical protein